MPPVDHRAAGAAGAFELLAQFLQERRVPRKAVDHRDGFPAAAFLSPCAASRRCGRESDPRPSGCTDSSLPASRSADRSCRRRWNRRGARSLDWSCLRYAASIDGTACSLPERILEAGRARARPRGHQPDFLAARPADLPPRHRRVRHEIPGVHDRPVLPGRQPAAGRGGRRRVRLARGEEFPGLLHQRHHAAAGRPDLLRRHPALAGAAVLGLRGPAERRDARQAAEGADRRREADLRLDQRAVHVARRHHLRRHLRVQRALDHRAGVFPHRAAARRPQLGAEPEDQDDSRK